MINSNMPKTIPDGGSGGMGSGTGVSANISQLRAFPKVALKYDNSLAQMMCHLCFSPYANYCCRLKFKVVNIEGDHDVGTNRIVNIKNTSCCCPVRFTARDTNDEDILIYTYKSCFCCCRRMEINRAAGGRNKTGDKIGEIKPNDCCCCNKCNVGTDIYNDKGDKVMYHGTNTPCCVCCKICCMSCLCQLCRCCKDAMYDVPVHEVINDERKEVSKSAFVVPCITRWCPYCCCLKTHQAMKFPAKANETDKHLLVGSLLYQRTAIVWPALEWIDSLENQ